MFCHSRDTVERFPGGLVVRIPGLHSCGPGLIPGQGTEIPQATRCGQKKKKKKRERDTLLKKTSPRIGENIFPVCIL